MQYLFRSLVYDQSAFQMAISTLTRRKRSAINLVIKFCDKWLVINIFADIVGENKYSADETVNCEHSRQ